MLEFGPDAPRLSDVFGRNVRAERARRGWEQEELGRRIGGWTQGMVSNLESGRRRLGVDDIAPICHALGLTLADLAIDTTPAELAALGLEQVRRAR